MRKRFRELAFILVVLGLFIVLLNITYIADASFSSYVRKAGFLNAAILFAFAMIFLVVSTFCGYVFGVSRGKGRMIEAEDLIPGKPFKILNVTLCSHSCQAFISIEIGGRKRWCINSFNPPDNATHIRVEVDDAGISRFEFVKITPEVIEVL